jgi:hypothetical protein
MPKGSLPATDITRVLIDEPERLLVHAWKNVIIFIWLGDAPAELMRKLGPVFEAYAREAGTLSVVSLVGNVAELPDESRRQAYKEFLLAYGARFSQLVVVLERAGFVGSAIRGLMTGLLLMSRQQHAIHVVSTLEEVAAWLPAKHAATTGVVLDARELINVLQRARAEGMARAPS